jgi:hypothetical protein
MDYRYYPTSGGLTMTSMVWELFVVGLLLYGLVSLAYMALSGRGGPPQLELPDHRDAPIVVTRRSTFATTRNMVTRTGLSDTTTA